MIKRVIFSEILKAFLNEEDAVSALDELLEDVETVLEENSRLKYHDRNGLEQFTQQITIVSIDTFNICW